VLAVPGGALEGLDCLPSNADPLPLPKLATHTGQGRSLHRAHWAVRVRAPDLHHTPMARTLANLSHQDVALDLLKRHSGIVWGPGLLAGLLFGGDVRRLGNPAGAPALSLTPGKSLGLPN